MKARGGKAFMDQSCLQCVPGENKVENAVSNPMSKPESPYLRLHFDPGLRDSLAAHLRRVHPTALSR